MPANGRQDLIRRLKFKRFKNRYSLRNVKVSGESARADVKAAEEFCGKYR